MAPAPVATGQVAKGDVGLGRGTAPYTAGHRSPGAGEVGHGIRGNLSPAYAGRREITSLDLVKREGPTLVSR